MCATVFRHSRHHYAAAPHSTSSTQFAVSDICRARMAQPWQRRWLAKGARGSQGPVMCRKHRLRALSACTDRHAHAHPALARRRCWLYAWVNRVHGPLHRALHRQKTEKTLVDDVELQTPYRLLFPLAFGAPQCWWSPLHTRVMLAASVAARGLLEASRTPHHLVLPPRAASGSLSCAQLLARCQAMRCRLHHAI